MLELEESELREKGEEGTWGRGGGVEVGEGVGG